MGMGADGGTDTGMGLEYLLWLELDDDLVCFGIFSGLASLTRCPRQRGIG